MARNDRKKMKLLDKDVKTGIINMFCMFQKLEENMNMSREIKNIFKRATCNIQRYNEKIYQMRLTIDQMLQKRKNP